LGKAGLTDARSGRVAERIALPGEKTEAAE
jgi:hypothetical protein